MNNELQTFRISFHLDDEVETHITDMYDMVSCPFNVGDEINISVEEPSPKEKDRIPQLLNDYKVKKELFHLKRVKLVRKYQSIDVELIRNNRYVIEFYCEIIDK